MKTLEIWHALLCDKNIERLEEIIAPDCVLLSPPSCTLPRRALNSRRVT